MLFVTDVFDQIALLCLTKKPTDICRDEFKSILLQIMKKVLNYLADNTWTWAGTGLVLITLSGTTFKQAFTLTAIAIVIHSVITLGTKEDQ